MGRPPNINTDASMKRDFLVHVDRLPSVGCWLWRGQIAKKTGYGRYRPSWSKLLYAHRISYSLFVGPIPANLYVCHHCDTPSCVNPAHLYVGTQQDNMRDAANRKRMPSGDAHRARARPETVLRGEQQWMHILTEEDVRFIRASSLRQRELCKMFGVKQTTISDIKHRKSWKHL